MEVYPDLAEPSEVMCRLNGMHNFQYAQLLDWMDLLLMSDPAARNHIRSIVHIMPVSIRGNL